MVENLNNKTLHKLYIFFIKISTWIIALGYLFGSICSSIGFDLLFLSYVGFIGVIPFIMILLSSFVFKFCIWHRLPLYYVVINNIIAIIDYFIHISPEVYILTNMIIFGVMSLLAAYLKNRYNKYRKNFNINDLMNKITLTNNNIHIEDSYKISKWVMRPFLKILKDLHPECAVFNRNISSLVLEWATHNLCYNLYIKRTSTKDVDLDYPQKWYYKIGYAICGIIAFILIK